MVYAFKIPIFGCTIQKNVASINNVFYATMAYRERKKPKPITERIHCKMRDLKNKISGVKKLGLLKLLSSKIALRKKGHFTMYIYIFSSITVQWNVLFFTRGEDSPRAFW